EIFRGSLFEPLTDRGIMADCIVSNPPYIAYDEEDDMDASVYRHEPHLALFADDGGMALYKQMVDGLPTVLKPGGTVYFEIGWRQYTALSTYITQVRPKDRPKLNKDKNRQVHIHS